MNFLNRHKRWAVLLISAAVILSFLVIAAAGTSPQVGRYRMSIVVRNNFADIYIIDTVTGVAKYAGKDFGKPFESISGK